jgi:hypothetical protein
MAQIDKTSEQIFQFIKDSTKNSTRFKVEKGKDFVDTEKSSKQINIILIKGNGRSDNLTIIAELLGRGNIEFEQKKITGSSFDQLIISSSKYKKIGRNEKEIRISFKYGDGTDDKNYDIWNEGLVNIFKLKRGLERRPRNRIEIDKIATINKKIEELGHKLPVTLYIRNKKFENVVGIVGGVGDTKADFVIVDKFGNEIGFLSYKDGRGADDFSQYGGLSQRAGVSIESHEEVVKFKEQVIDLAPKDSVGEVIERWNGTPLYKKIRDSNLKNKAVFGENYRLKSGYDSVDFIVQGQPILTSSKIGNNIIVILKFTTKTILKGEISKLSGAYEPVLGARKGEIARIIKISGKSKLTGVRTGIFPYRYMEKRTGSQEIVDDK